MMYVMESFEILPRDYEWILPEVTLPSLSMDVDGIDSVLFKTTGAWYGKARLNLPNEPVPGTCFVAFNFLSIDAPVQISIFEDGRKIGNKIISSSDVAWFVFDSKDKASISFLLSFNASSPQSSFKLKKPFLVPLPDVEDGFDAVFGSADNLLESLFRLRFPEQSVVDSSILGCSTFSGREFSDFASMALDILAHFNDEAFCLNWTSYLHKKYTRSLGQDFDDLLNVASSLYSNNRWVEYRVLQWYLLEHCEAWQGIKSELTGGVNSCSLESVIVIFLMHKNIGDTLGLCLTLKEIARKYSSKLILIAYDTKVVRAIVGMISSDFIENVIFTDDVFKRFYKPGILLQSWRRGGVGALSLNPPGQIIPGKTSVEDFYATGSHFDLYKLKVGLPANAPLDELVVSECSLKNAKTLFDKYNLPLNRTVLFSTHSNSIDKINGEKVFFDPFYIEVMRLCAQHGYTVVFNGTNHNSTVDNKFGCISVDVPLCDIVPFVDLCGFFVGVRSGLADLLCFSHARRMIVYPNRKGFFRGSLSSYGVNEVSIDLFNEALLELESMLR